MLPIIGDDAATRQFSRFRV